MVYKIETEPSILISAVDTEDLILTLTTLFEGSITIEEGSFMVDGKFHAKISQV